MTDSRAMSSFTMDRKIFMTIWFMLPTIMILMDWVVCIPLHKAKTIVWIVLEFWTKNLCSKTRFFFWIQSKKSETHIFPFVYPLIFPESFRRLPSHLVMVYESNSHVLKIRSILFVYKNWDTNWQFPIKEVSLSALMLVIKGH